MSSKRLYRLSLQEKSNYCLPAVIQAILRNRSIEKTQKEIAEQVGVLEEGVRFNGLLTKFFNESGFSLQYYWYDEVPFKDPSTLVLSALEREQDVFLGYNISGARHVRLATSFTDPLLSLLDPANCSEVQEDIYALHRKMYQERVGVFGLVS